MSTAFNNNQLQYNTSSAIGNVKRENMFKQVQSNVTITTNESASNLTANIFLLIRHYLI